MAFWDKFKFWRREIPDFPQSEPAHLAPSIDAETGGGFPAERDEGFAPRDLSGGLGQGFDQFPGSQERQGILGQSRNAEGQSDQRLELISSKLDTIKAQLDVVLNRLDRLERNEGLGRPYQQRWR
ncbi:hypothetical protein D6825_02860 [Candidatus Woesearchaeota archaeon]|nr:MAG: hypothetical protein D6825_02860 [Candidatus Woesearchaeota archaeon]